MPLADRDGVALLYERTGAGAPVLLVMGLGMTATVAVLGAAGVERRGGRVGEHHPTHVVVHGTEDRMILPQNADILHERIEGAELLWPGAGHPYPTDEPAADRQVAVFLTS